MAQIVYTLAAERDLEELFDWIAADSSAQRAAAVLNRIGQTIELIAETPRIGRVRRDLDGEPRTFAVWPWVIVYEPLSDEPGIVVWRVIDGRRNLPRHIRR